MLKGHLCTVRHLLNTDLNTFIALDNDLPSRGAYFSTQFKSPEALRKEFMMNSFVSEDHELFVIEDSFHHIVGKISHFKSRAPTCREIGYRLYDPALAGRGYVSEATQLLVNYLFGTYPYQRLELLMDPRNLGSEQVARKCGFSQEGTLRNMFFVNGELCDAKIYSLLRREWETGRLPGR